MRSSMNAALTGGLLLLAGATGAMASGRGSGYVIDSPYAVSPALTVLSALARRAGGLCGRPPVRAPALRRRGRHRRVAADLLSGGRSGSRAVFVDRRRRGNEGSRPLSHRPWLPRPGSRISADPGETPASLGYHSGTRRSIPSSAARGRSAGTRASRREQKGSQTDRRPGDAEAAEEIDQVMAALDGRREHHRHVEAQHRPAQSRRPRHPHVSGRDDGMAGGE